MVKYCFTSLEWLSSKTLTTSNAGEDAEQQEALLIFVADGNAEWYSHLGRQCGSISQN